MLFALPAPLNQSAGPNTVIEIVSCLREHEQEASPLCLLAEEQSSPLHMQEHGLLL